MNRLISFLLFVLFISCGMAQTIKFSFDYANYRNDENSNYIEIYYSIDEKSFTKQNKEGKDVIDGEFNIIIKNVETGKEELNQNWKINKIIDETNGNKNLLGVLPLRIEKGNYEIFLTLKDNLNNDNIKTLKEKLVVSPYKNETISVSDVELANNIKTNSQDSLSIFYKNTLEVIPNPELVYSESNPAVFYYSELYNLNLTNNPLHLQVNLINETNEVLYTKTKRISNNPSVVESGVLNVKKYPTGIYNLVLSVIDSTLKKNYTTVKKFYLVNPSVKVEKKELLGKLKSLDTEFSVLGPAECDEHFAYAKYIASNDEINYYKNLDSVQAKREFLADFWKKRDMTKDSDMNEFKNEYYSRIDEANRLYSTFTKKGYKSDRGRVYAIYGKPSTNDKHPSDMDAKPYEIWFYEQMEGGVAFYFSDISGYGDYELVHSTKRGEVYDPNWMARVFKAR